MRREKGRGRLLWEVAAGAIFPLFYYEIVPNYNKIVRNLNI